MVQVYGDIFGFFSGYERFFIMHENVDIAVSVRKVSKNFSFGRGILGVLAAQPGIGQYLAGFRRKVVLKDVSFDVKRGSIFGLVGRNAAGKSTLLRIIAGLIVPDGGEVEVFGKAPGRASRISIMSSRDYYDYFTALDQLKVIARLYQLDVDRAIETAKSLWDLLGVKEEDYTFAVLSHLSTGTLGKVALVFGLLPLLAESDQGEGLLLLDEPTSGFDPFAREEFFKALLSLRQLFPLVTVIITSHVEREVAFCDSSMSLDSDDQSNREEAHQVFQNNVAAADPGTEAFKTLIDPKLAASQNRLTEQCQLSRIPKQYHSAIETLGYRLIVDFRRNSLSFVTVILQLVIPNLMVFFAMVSQRGFVQSFLTWMLGVYVTLMLRDSMRVFEREWNVFRMLNALWLSPMSRSSHLYTTTVLQWGFQTLIVMVAAVILLITVHGQWTFADFGPALAAACSMEMALTIVGMLLALYSMGLMISYLPLALSGGQTFLFWSVVPFFCLIGSGIYYEPSELPPGLREFCSLNPLSYAAYAYRDILGIENGSPLFLIKLVDDMGIPGTAAQHALLVLWVLTGPILLVSNWVSPKVEMMLRRAGRFHV
jgi:ABC-2 type transport system ATP-binding protein